MSNTTEDWLTGFLARIEAFKASLEADLGIDWDATEQSTITQDYDD